MALSYSPCCLSILIGMTMSYILVTLAADIISCVEFNHDGDLLATGDKGGRVVIFQRDPSVSTQRLRLWNQVPVVQ